MTTVAIVQLVAPQTLGTSSAVLYSAPTQTTAKIGRAVFVNTSGSAVTISAGITTGGALGASTTLVPALPLAAGATYVSPELAGAVIPQGSALCGFASATGVTFTASGLTQV